MTYKIQHRSKVQNMLCSISPSHSIEELPLKKALLLIFVTKFNAIVPFQRRTFAWRQRRPCGRQSRQNKSLGFFCFPSYRGSCRWSRQLRPLQKFIPFIAEERATDDMKSGWSSLSTILGIIYTNLIVLTEKISITFCSCYYDIY